MNTVQLFTSENECGTGPFSKEGLAQYLMRVVQLHIEGGFWKSIGYYNSI
jgi:hypothetical protein